MARAVPIQAIGEFHTGGRSFTRNRMSSVLLVSTVVASVGFSIAIGALVLRIALRLLGHILAK